MDAYILPIKLRAKIALMKIMFSLKENDQFIDNRVLTTRPHTATVFKVARPNSFIFQNSVAYVGPRDWNNLSVDRRSVNDMKVFDCLIKNCCRWTSTKPWSIYMYCAISFLYSALLHVVGESGFTFNYQPFPHQKTPYSDRL